MTRPANLGRIGADEPGGELAPVGRDARGRFVADNDGHLMHGAHSRKRSLLLVPIRREMCSGILADLGHTDEDAPRALSIVVDQLVEARLIAQSYFEFLAASGGAITTKGRQRRAVEGYMRASDRVAKFASMIGLEKRARRVNESAREWLMRTSNERQTQSDNENDEQSQQEQKP